MRKTNNPLFFTFLLFFYSYVGFSQCTIDNTHTSGSRTASQIGMSFTTACAGNLESVTVTIVSMAGGDGAISNASVSVYSGDDGTGAGTLVGSALTGQTLSVGANLFDFSASNVVLTNATQYTFVIDDNGDADDITVYSQGAGFAGGQSWLDGAPDSRNISFSLNINDIPIITIPAAQTITELETLTLSTGNTNLISIADGDSDPQTVDLAASNSGTLTLASTAGITFNSGSDGSGAMNITGALSAINTALDGLQYDPNGDNGAQSITISTDDGNGGADGPDVLTINVNTVPSYTATWLDSNGDGHVDQLQLDFSEAVLIDDQDGSGFNAITLTSGTITEADYSDISGTATQLTLDVTGLTGTAIPSVTIAYDGSNSSGSSIVSDDDATEVADVGPGTTNDGAAPVVLDLEIRDDGDGFVDEIRVTWSENVDTDDGNAPGSADFGTITLPDGNTATLSGITDPAGATNIVTLTGITGHTATTNTAAGSTAIATIPAGAWTDGINLNVATAGDFEAVTDGAAPVIIDATWNDQNGNGHIDQVVLTFSETVDITDGNALDGFGAILVNDGGSVTIDDANYANTGVTSLTLNFTGDEISGTGIAGLSVTYDDAGANAIEDVVPNEMVDADVAEAYSDAAAPVVLDLEIRDDGDGFVDEIRVTWSENVDTDDSNPPISADFGTITLPDGNPATLSVIPDPAGATNIVILTGITGHTATRNTAAGSTAIATIPAGAWTDGTNLNVGTAGDFEAVTDAAAPVLVSSTPADEASGVAIGTNIDLVFSENVAAGTGNITVDDIVGLDDRAVAIGDAQVSILTNTVTLDLSADLNYLDDYAVQVAATAIEDLATVPNTFAGIADQTTINFQTTAPTPVITDVEWQDNDGNGTVEQVLVTFNVAIDFTDGDGAVDVDGFNSIVFSDANVALSTAGDSDFSGVNAVNSYLFTLGTPYASTASPAVTITYNQAATTVEEIFADLGGTEMADGGHGQSYTDGAAPVITDATWNDQNGNGHIDQVVLTFSETVDITDGNAGDGFGAILVNDGGAVTLDVADYGNPSVASLTLNFTGDEISGTGIGGLSVTYDDAGANAIADGVPNEIVDADVAESYSDGAAPVVLDLEIRDDGDGFVDEIQVTWSENVDTDDGNAPASADFGTITLPDGNPATLSVISDPAGATNIVTLTGITGHTAVPNTASGSTAIATIPAGAWTDGTNLNAATAGNFETVNDAALPAIIYSQVEASNNFVTVAFSEDLTDNGDGDITVSDFDITINDGGASVSVSDVVNQEEPALSLVAVNLPEDTLVFTLSAVDLSAVGSTENIEIAIKTVGNTIVDLANNEPDIVTPESTGALPFNDISFNVTILSITAAPDNSYLEIVFSEPVARNTAEDANIRLVDTEDDGDIRNAQWTNGFPDICGSCRNEDELMPFYNDGGSGVTIEDNDNTDIYLGTSPAGTKIQKSSGYISDTFRFYLNPNDAPIPAFRGVEYYTFTVLSGATIRGVTTDGFMSSSYVSPRGYFNDTYGDDFDDAIVAEAYDVNSDGNIDEVVVRLEDYIDDASLAASLADFTFNGVSPTSVVASPLNPTDLGVANDSVFTLGFTTYVGTAVVGDLIFGGTLTFTDDAGNLIQAGQVTPSDEAGPVILSARTNDADLDGNVDEINVTFSEPFTEVGTVTTGDFTAINDVTFSHGTYSISGVTVSSPNIILDVSKDGAGTDTNSRPNFTVAAGIIQDGETATNPLQTFTGTTDGAKAFARVDNLTTTNNQPSITGTISEAGIINVVVDGSTYEVSPGDINVGAGTWILDNSGGSLFTLGALGNYEIILVTIDNGGNVGTDIPGPELTINGGVVPSHNGDLVGNSVTALCGNNQFTPLGDIELAETNATDFSIQSNKNLLLELPTGSRFNQSATLTITDNSQDINAGTDITYSFISSRILELEFDVTGNSGTDVITIQGIEVASTAVGTGIQLTRGGGNIQMLGSNAIGTPFAEMDVSAATASGTDVSISYTLPVAGTENNVMETSMLTGATFTATPNGVSGIDTLWYDDDGTTVLMNSSSGSGSVSEADILPAGNNTPGLFTRYVAYDDSPTTCLSEFLTINFLVYTFDDGGLNTEFDGAVYDLSASDDPFDITFSRPSGHSAVATGTPVSAVSTGTSTTVVTIDPNQGDGSYPVSYTITNPLGESVSLTATFNITTTSPLYESGTFELNGGVTATDNEYCTNDVLSFEVNNAHVATLEGANSFFYAIGWVPVSYALNPSNVRVTEMVTPGTAVLTNGATMTSSNPTTGWGIDLDAIYQLAVNPANATEENYGRAALLSGVRLVSVFMKHGGTFSTTVDPALNGTLGLVHPFEMLEIPSLNIADVNAINYCVDDNADVTLQAIVDGGTIDMDNGYQLLLASDNSVQATETDAFFNPADYAPNSYKIVYETDPNPAGCTNIDTLQITVNAVPVDPLLTTTPIYLTDYLPDFYIDNSNQYLGLDTWVFEIPNIDSLVSGTNIKEYVLVDNTSGSTYNWYNDNGGTPGDLLVSNTWVFYYNSWFDDPATTTVVEQPAPGEYTFYVAKTTNGCESAYRRFKIFIYNKSTRPLPLASYQTNLNSNVDEANIYQQGTGHYIAEFCENYGGNEIVFNGPNESASNPTSPFASDGAYLNIYSSIAGGSEPDTIRAVIDDAGGNAVLTAADFGYSGTGAFDTTIYVTHVWNDRTPGFGNTGTNGVNDFEGTESLPTRIDISIFVMPTLPTLATDFPTLSSLDLHICEGETFSSFLNSAAGIDTYVWYDAAGTTEIMRVNSGSQMTSANLLANASAAQYDNTVPNIYTFQVSRIANSNGTSGFEGCESPQTTFTIEVHPIDDTDYPIISSGDYSDEGDLSYDQNTTADHIFPVCLTELNPAAVLNVSSAYVGTKEFVWYTSNASFSTQNELITSSAPTFDQLNMGVGDISSAQSKYFIVTQRLDPDDFPAGGGCESSVATTYVEVQFSDLSALTMNLTNGPDYCWDDTDESYLLLVGGIPANPLEVRYSVLLTNSTTADTLEVASVPVQGAGNITTDFDAWHIAKGGNAPDGSGNIVGGISTTHYILMEYTDPSTNCVGNEIFTITIHPDPPASFTIAGLDVDDQEFCYDDNGFDVLGFNYETGLGLSQNTGSFSVNTAGLGVTNNNKATFDPSDAHNFGGGNQFSAQSAHQITFTYTDAFGCQRDTTRTVYVNPLPQIVDNEIKSASTCASTDIKLFVEMADNEFGQGKDAYNFVWQVNGGQVQDLDGTAEGDTLVYNLGTSTSANFSVFVTYIGTGIPGEYSTNCMSSVVGQSITVGEAPDPSITWVGVTEGRETTFRIEEDNAGLPDADVNYIEFFVNGVSQYLDDESGITPPPITFPLGINYNPSSPGYAFGDAGTYVVRVLMRTTAGCEVDFSRTIDIIEHLPGLTSYTESFESGAAGWTIETLSINGKANDLTTSWEIGASVPDLTGVGIFDGSNAIYTNGYQPSEQSFVYSPSFDLSAFSSPTISFLRMEDFETFRDGVVFQMSTNDGRTWVNVGGFDDNQPEGLKSTPGWYNKEAITSAPGIVSPGPLSSAQNNQGIGWALNSDWEEAIAPLAIPVGEEDYVRFRFALAAQATPKTTNGFAFDLVQIYDRQQVVLVEQFSSTLSSISKNVNNAIDNAPIFNGNDVLRINYFTDFANNGANIDQLNQRNTSAPGAKSSFYGIEDIPSLAIAGEPEYITNISQLSGSIAAQLTNAKLVNPGFDIEINASIDTENVLSVGADFTAISDFTGANTKLGLFIAILEPQIIVRLEDTPRGEDPTNNNLPNTIGFYQIGDTITNVLRKMMPSAAGQFEQGAVAINDVLSIANMTWPVSNMYVIDTLTVVAYVQNLTTKQVLQSEVMGLSNPNTELALGLDKLPDFSLYPNPADKQVTVEFADGIGEDAEWVIYDQAGREVLKGEIKKGTKTMTVQTTEMPSGLYFIHLYAEDRKRQAKRIMVVH